MTPKPPPPLIRFIQCANCGDRVLLSETTFNYCDACGQAFVKGAVTTFAMGFGGWLIGYVLWAAGRLW